ncbi:hypothetical protein NGB36_01640 [Streptomyces sp. RB6PN25]|uniref:Uncharacterized protein n=2 Tax=Streptomyces humicola TaxID=2953240 RepID=A0ABT1PNS9_9ACTN|nr:hypothetical protein [Streptomyces humicola]MCQ4079341.1 hypothetical protein [Streptomyces humicola]
MESRFTVARQVADAVLFEGYVLYPYRASAAKNQLRWQFGVLVPPSWASSGAEHSSQRTECLMEPRAGAALSVELRFLRAQRRTVQRALGDGTFETVAELDVADRVLVPWVEGVEERIALTVPVADLVAHGVEVPFSRPAHQETESVVDADRTVGRLLRARERADGVLRLSATEIDGPYAALRLTAVVENTSGWSPEGGEADRDAALLRSLVSAHLLLGLSAGSFLSMADPPEWARSAASACSNEHTWPVLAGESGGANVILSSPIILEDHPRIAPESPGALYDATEIDEILTLRTAALTEQEKREARGTDPRAGAVIDLAESLPAEVLERLHGAVRSLRSVTGPAPAEGPGDRPAQPWWDPAADPGVDPTRDRIAVDGHSVGAGSRVRLRPGARRTDAQDLFLTGRTALVEAVLHDVDGAVHLAVTVDGDPGADLRREQGRFLYFQPDEIEPLEDA